MNKALRKFIYDDEDDEIETNEDDEIETDEGEDEKNPVAVALKIIAWVIYIGGFFAGIVLSAEFSFVIAFVCWCAFFVGGTLFLGFAEIINLLNAIKNK